MPWMLVWLAFSELGGWPLNDDPFYAKPLSIWSAEGEWKTVKQIGELTASSVAHQITGALATQRGDFSYRSLFLVCIAQQSLAVAVLYCTNRALGLPFGIASLAAASFGLFPLYFGHAFTFMTDGPATAWSVLALCFASLGVIRDDIRWLLAASFAVGWGFWIRQTNGLLLLGPLVTCGILFVVQSKTYRLRGLLALLALAIPAGCSFGLLESGWLVDSSVSRYSDVAPGLDASYVRETIIAAYGGFLLLGWFMLPWIFIAGRAAIVLTGQLNGSTRLLCCAASILAVIAGAIPFMMTAGDACLTNSTGAFVQNAHYGPIFLSDMDEPGRWSQLDGVAWPLAIWKMLTVAAIASSGVVAWWVAWSICNFFEHLSRDTQADQKRPIAVAIGLLASIFMAAVVLIFFVEPHMDRYWLFVLVAIAVWWTVVIGPVARRVSEGLPDGVRLWRWTPMSSGWAVGCMLLNSGMSLVFTHDMLAWNNLRWQYIHSQLAAGMRADEIDGGRDVNAWLRLDEDPDSMPREGDTSAWWSGRATRAMAVGKRPGWREVDRIAWSAWATGRKHHLLILERVPLDKLGAVP